MLQVLYAASINIYRTISSYDPLYIRDLPYLDYVLVGIFYRNNSDNDISSIVLIP